MNRKILTILIPVYNTEKYIKRCLDSVLTKETIDDIEVIVVSDGSKDGSAKIIKEYVKKYPKTLKFVEKENGGHGSTINVGISKATGKYFKVLDSDDWFNCIDFIKFVKILKKEDSDIVVTNYSHEILLNNKSVYNKYNLLENGKQYKIDDIDLSILNGEYFVMATSTYKTEILRKSKLNLMEKTFYVDMQYNIVPILMIKTFAYYDLDIYKYFIGRIDQSVNMTSYVNHELDHKKVMEFLILYYEDNKEKMSINKQKYISMIINYMLYTHYTIFCLYDKKRKKAYKLIKEFDDFLFEKSPELYNKSNKMSFIKANRKTKFIFVLINGMILKKTLTILSLLRRNKNA